ncbi:hypothetical protein [Flavobacterium sp.]|uniref:hypothetical protein n=1 Tax=Flavobacterium sp. TaxID=239 RepID=UPI0040332790
MERSKIFIAAVFAGLAFSCSDEDSKTTNTATVQEVFDTMSVGKWKVINFVDGGNDHTADYAGFIFRFNKNTSAISAVNGGTTYTGMWSVTSEDDGDATSDVDFNINFTEPDDFMELSDDWDVVELGVNMVKLKDVGDESDGTDYLTFEKDLQ